MNELASSDLTGILAGRRAVLSPESRDLVRHLTERIDARVRLRMTREALGLTQVEAALISGVSQSDISRIETGETSPTVERFSRILGRLGEWAEANAGPRQPLMQRSA
jgi:predicted transcriptional regulator